MKAHSRHRMNIIRQRGIYILPNLFTSGNLFCGFFATMTALGNGRYIVAATAILIAALLDTLDGKLARLTRTSSRFGVEFDSLADIISFGMAPCVLLYTWGVSHLGRLGLAGLFLYIVCGALRLARFNVQAASVERHDYAGLPIPAAACLIASWIIFDDALHLDSALHPMPILGITYMLAFLMISTIRYRSLKSLELKHKKPLPVLVGFLLCFLLLMVAPEIVIFVGFASYALLGMTEKPAMALYRILIGKPAVMKESPIGKP